MADGPMLSHRDMAGKKIEDDQKVNEEELFAVKSELRKKRRER